MVLYRVEISMIKPYEIIAEWPRKPSLNDVLEAFRDALLTSKADECFRIEVSEEKEGISRE